MLNLKVLVLGMEKVRVLFSNRLKIFLLSSLDLSPRGSIDARKPLNLNIEPSIREGSFLYLKIN